MLLSTVCYTVVFDLSFNIFPFLPPRYVPPLNVLIISSRWIDQRNESRRAQFEAARANLLASVNSSVGATAAGSSVRGGSGDVAEKEVDPKEKTFGTTAEFAGLAARMLHVGVGQVILADLYFEYASEMFFVCFYPVIKRKFLLLFRFSVFYICILNIL